MNHTFGYNNRHASDDWVVTSHLISEYRGITYELISNHALFSYPKMDEQLFGQLQSKYNLFRLRNGKYSVTHDDSCQVFDVIDKILKYEAECKRYAPGGEEYNKAVHKFELLQTR